MKVDFYQLSRDPAEQVVPLLARNTLGLGQRLLVVSEDKDQLGRIGDALWARDGTFLANGQAGGDHDARQPVLLSAGTEPANGARYVVLADGKWRAEAEAFDRVFLLFDGSTIDDARGTWRSLDGRDGLERAYWRQEGGKWIKAA
ncbi:DNA polymerase III subunit chi [Novosphingobium sp. B 225]|uniref:DNA polymerase III subunit chi n=1 Tax=Novosphingobium sp. B 225 TaxID=1961849 RepID=UPI000B4B0EE3|nr:DNA polymerase III subunit chi [Novosphingobium sp. B 225]